MAHSALDRARVARLAPAAGRLRRSATTSNFLKHTLAHYHGDDAPRIGYGDVKITNSPPGTRAYGAAGEKAERERRQEAAHA